jgi:Cu2+-exporting ATPase
MVQSAQVHLSNASQWLGAFLFDEQLRPEAKQVIEQLLKRGLGVEIFSGDQVCRVRQISQVLGLQEDQAHAELSPQDKLHRIRSLQVQGHKVLMVGDGFNDLPVLAGADVSMVFGSATLLAQELADCVVLNPSLTWVIGCLNHAQRTLQVVHQNLLWAFAYNLICIPMALLGFLPSWLAGLGMALSSLGVGLNAYRLQLKSSIT